MTCLSRPLILGLAWLMLGVHCAGAQPMPVPVPVVPASGASAAVPVVPESAMSPAASPAASNASVAPASVVSGCRPITDKAMVADLAAVTAQSKKLDLAEQSRLFNEAVSLWTQAQTQCTGHAKESARRNRDDDLQMLDRVLEKLDSGPQCASAHKDAGSLQDIARQALTERRWMEAAALFRKAESRWEYAAERCTGSQQDAASRRREQSAQDGHNAQFCAPLFEKAREHTQKLRGAAATLSKNDKHDAQMVAETLWRDALGQCRGAAVQEIAANNANALARDRGTPWVPRQAPAEKPVQQSAASDAAGVEPIALFTSTLIAPAVPGKAVAPLANPGAPTLADAPSMARAVAAAAPPFTAGAIGTSASAPEPTVQHPGDISVGDTRFVGKFYRDANATTVSGTGKVTWPSGDVFEGTLVNGKRQGQGRITWANGQRYEGDWVQDQPTGQGKMHFANGNDYDGSVVAGVPQGAGHMRYASGDVFDGQFKDGEPDQLGVYVWRNGQRYDGTWQRARPNGSGKLKFASGNQYEGVVVDGKPQGLGRMVFAGGEVYTGQFRDGQPDGQGTFAWPNGDQYVGQWAMGKKHGNGAFTWKSGERWEGIYDNDVQKN